MKSFVIINGKTMWVVKRDSLADAVTTAENTCDVSKEIIVREITPESDFDIDTTLNSDCVCEFCNMAMTEEEHDFCDICGDCREYEL